MGLIYEVNIAVQRELASEYLEWLRHHMAEMQTFEGFESADLYAVDNDDEKYAQFCCQYHLRDRAALDHYLSEHSAAMRADGLNRFGQRFSASRRILHRLPS